MPVLTSPSLLILHHHYHKPRRLAAAVLPQALLSLFSLSPRTIPTLPISLYPIPNFRRHSTGSSTQTHSLPTDNARGGRSGSLASPPVQPDFGEKIDVNPPKGTRDFPPEDMRLRNWLFQNFKEVRTCSSIQFPCNMHVCIYFHYYLSINYITYIRFIKDIFTEGKEQI